MKVGLIDLEANGLLDSATTLWCGSIKLLGTDIIESYHWQEDNPEWHKELLEAMDSYDVLVAHNGYGYDFPLLEKLYGYTYKGKKIDTMVMSRLHKPHRTKPSGYTGKGGPHSIECWGFRLGRYKPEHEDWSQFSPEMLHRNKEDVEILQLLLDELKLEAVDLEGSWKQAYETDFRLFEILHKQAAYGWKIDQRRLAIGISLTNHWKARIERILATSLPYIAIPEEKKENGQYKYLVAPFLKSGKPSASVAKWFGEDCSQVGGLFSRVSFRRMEVGDKALIKQLLLDSGWCPLEWNEDKNGDNTSPKLSYKDPFEGVEGILGKLVAKYSQCSHRNSMLQGWSDRLRPDGRLPAGVSSLAATGRATHREVVNVPNCESFFGKYIRSLFICDEDKLLVSTDAKGCQDRMLAQRAGSSDFRKMLLEGKKSDGSDGHSVAMKAVNSVHAKHGLEPISRLAAKGYNFGYKFGASNGKLGLMSKVGPEIGGEIKESLNAAFPAQAALVEKLEAEWRKNAMKIPGKHSCKFRNGWIKGLDGRPVYMESSHTVLVYMLQSDEAIMMAYAYVLLHDRLINDYGLKWGTDWAYVGWIHDEYTIECLPKHAELIARESEKAIADAGEHFGLTFCPQEGEAAIGRSWLEVH